MKAPFLAGLVCVLSLGSSLPLPAQTLPSDPGAAQDAEADRKKLLKAADQIDLLQQSVDNQTQQLASLRTQLDQARADLDAQKAQLAALKADNDSLRDSLKQLDAAREGERKALIEQVSKIVADAGKRASAPAPAPAETPKPAPSDGGAAAPDQKGYDYVVVKGDTLSAISAAYAAQGVKVTIDDLRKANNLSKTDTIHVGQKLFIPKK